MKSRLRTSGSWNSWRSALPLARLPLAILRSWRTGFYFFPVWMLFEDLARKYMGNNLALFFGKDILLALVYFVLQGRPNRTGRNFRPPFLLFLSSFFLAGCSSGLQSELTQ